MPAHRDHRGRRTSITAADLVLSAAVTVAAVVTTWTWLTGQLAALLFRGGWPSLTPGRRWERPCGCRGTWATRAWPGRQRAAGLPGPFGFVVAGPLSSPRSVTGARLVPCGARAAGRPGVRVAAAA